MVKKPITKTTGSRKRATARVWLYKGKGETVINDRPIDEYFSLSLGKGRLEKPFLVTNTGDKYYATVKVSGGGRIAQVGAIAHGLARALDNVDREKYHSLLKEAGLLTRDPREKERRKPGTARKARAKRQSPKR